ncbi:MAG: PIN domain-containing protein [Candidatus Scalindua sp. AMX11]|nr:MAG: PIN domain-containing protein [Candidatus Scalindua sp.]NOG85044.1 PIN domain-containing protein [Planctomycetota bacterium]RZV93095.1 MAG: PIN domain-containing protein [Candidatus Scalindua sp. SCAELEC01]TDE66721.1 MAG: PIN domain-containing protein [Candidatus Scalindua sp. AMX11]GJQ58028.1 MAG: pilus biogenesis protein [Candidatus Scalindua sp.]
MNKKFIDTNIFLRYLTKDDPLKYDKCKRLFKKTIEGKLDLVTSGMVIAELVWTLRSYYKVSKADVIEKISIIVSTQYLFIPEKDIIVDALVLYGRKNIDYIDAYNAVFMKYHGLSEVYSYDTDFDSIESIKREEP